MSRPRKKPSIEEQLRTIIAQALEEKEFYLALALTETLKMFAGKQLEKKEGE